MSKLEKENLKSVLNRWKLSIKRDPATAQNVLNKIATYQQSGYNSALRNKVVTYLMATGVAAILVLGTIFILNQREQTKVLQNQQYITLIDPVTRAHLHDDTASRDKLLNQLSWMQDRLDLSREQFMSLVDLHQNYSNQFDQLYEDLLLLESRYNRFESQRKSDEMVDFIALYDLLTDQKEKQTLAHKLSQELVSKVSGILSPSQRTAYLSLVTKELSPNA